MPTARTEKSFPARLRIALVVSRYNATITNALRDGAIAAIRERLGDERRIDVIEAPGAYELPALSMSAAGTGRYSGIAALGCLIKGQTRHDRYIADAVAHGLVNVTMITGVPCAFGVITAETAAQAAARAGGTKGNKGREAAEALLDTMEMIDRIELDRIEPASAEGRSRPDKARGTTARDGGRQIKRKEAKRS